MSAPGTPAEESVEQGLKESLLNKSLELNENSTTILPDGNEATTKGVEETSLTSSGNEAKGSMESMSRSVLKPDEDIPKAEELEEEEDRASSADNVGEASQEVLVSSNEVKNIVLQILSPYFDDDGGGDDPISSHTMDEKAPGAGGDDGRDQHSPGDLTRAEAGLVDDDYYNDTAQRYDHNKSMAWTQLICDGIMKKLILMDKPFKYVVHCMIMRKTGAGIHVCSSNYYGQADGCLSHSHDLNPHIYAAVTVYWSGI